MKKPCLILFLSLFAVWCVIFPLIALKVGLDAAKGQTLTGLACLFGGLTSIVFVGKIRKSQDVTVASFGPFWGMIPRLGIPAAFLIFSIIFYRDPMDRRLLLGIILSYFVYYPVMLLTELLLVLPREKDSRKTHDE